MLQAVTIARIYNIAATRIQAYYRGHKIRNTYTKEVKNLMFKHNKLLKEKGHRSGESVKRERRKKKRSRKNRSKSESHTDPAASDDSNTRVAQVAGDFLGSVVEGHQRSSYLRRVQPGEDAPLQLARSRSQPGAGGATLLGPSLPAAKERSESRFSYNLNK